MKRIIALLLIAFLTTGMMITAGAASDSRKVDADAVTDLIREYRNKDGFEIVSVGSMGLGIVSIIAKASAESQEDREMLDILNGLSKIVVVEFEDAGPSDRDAFTRKMGAILEGAEKIIEVKDEGETLDIYGTSADEGRQIEDIIIYVQEDQSLICLFGKISAEKIADIVQM